MDFVAAFGEQVHDSDNFASKPNALKPSTTSWCTARYKSSLCPLDEARGSVPLGTMML